MVQNNSYSKVVSIYTRWEKEKQDALQSLQSGYVSEEAALALLKIAARNPVVAIVGQALTDSRKPNPNPAVLQKKVLEEAATKIVSLITQKETKTVFTVHRENEAKEILQALTTTPLTKNAAAKTSASAAPKPGPAAAISKPSPKPANLKNSGPTPLTVALTRKQLVS